MAALLAGMAVAAATADDSVGPAHLGQ
jgi:hypothetical protein